jgi:hypothetical protein
MAKFQPGDLLMCVGASDHPLTVGKVYEVQTAGADGFWSEWPWLRADDGQLHCFPQRRFLRVAFATIPGPLIS